MPIWTTFALKIIHFCPKLTENLELWRNISQIWLKIQEFNLCKFFNLFFQNSMKSCNWNIFDSISYFLAKSSKSHLNLKKLRIFESCQNIASCHSNIFDAISGNTPLRARFFVVAQLSCNQNKSWVIVSAKSFHVADSKIKTKVSKIQLKFFKVEKKCKKMRNLILPSFQKWSRNQVCP